MYRHVIVNTTSNLVENIIEYSSTITGQPDGFPSNYIAVKSDTAQMGATYNSDSTFTNPTPVDTGIPNPEPTE